MDIKELNKKQLILLTLLITFVVSIATGIVTVSLMNQMPKAVPQTINNVIQRTIEKVTTVETPAKEITEKKTSVFGDGDAIIPIYNLNIATNVTTGETSPDPNTKTGELGQGIIISEVGLILVDSSILNEAETYKVVLNKIDFDAVVLKKFSNGFTVLKIKEKKAVAENPEKNSANN